MTATEPAVACKAADTTAHAKRPIYDAEGFCYRCHHARRRRRRRQGRLSAVRRLFGLSEEDLDALVTAQGGRCWICRRRVGVVKAGAVDHDHKCLACGGKGCRQCVRGMLCGTCNQWLGHVGDDPQAGVRAATYLISKPGQKVLRELDKLRQDETDSVTTE